VLTYVEFHYVILPRTLERGLILLQNSVINFKELNLNFVQFDISVLL
jgi:hypothetical protein